MGLKPLQKLIPYLKPYKTIIIVSCLLAIPLAALRFSPAPLVKYLVDDLLVNRESNHLYLFPLLIIGIFVLNFFVRFFHYYLIRIVMARVNQRIKCDLQNHLLGLSADYYTEKSTGSLISRVGNDPQYIDAGISCINVLFREPFTFLFLFGYALYLDWQLTLITVTIFPFLAWLFSATGKNLKNNLRKMAEENAHIFSSLQETFSGIRVIKAFNLQEFVQRKFNFRVENFTKFNLKIAALQEAAHPLVELLSAFAIAGVIFYGGKQVLSGTMTSGDLVAFFTAFAMMVNPVRVLGDVSLKLHQAAAATERIFEIFSWRSRLKASPHPKKFSFQKSIELKNIHFSYPDAPEIPILKGINLEIRKGEAVALVGASGAGKSSLVNLIPRIFDVTQGEIQIDGIDTRKFDLKDLRNQIAVVSQDVFLFNDTILENIRCGRLHSTESDILKAAQHAHALEFIQKLPKGLQTIIGDRGQKLSGGERQRLSIARAFLKGAPILILDEATSSLDSESEKMVQQALEDLMKERTTLMIAHRLSTIRHADHIVVIENGKIVESGHHTELIERKGAYAHFHGLL